MGISWSNNRRRNSHHYHPPPPPPHHHQHYYSEPPLLPPPPQPNHLLPTTSSTSFAPPPPPPPQVQPYNHQFGAYPSYNYPNPGLARFNFHPHYSNHHPNNGLLTIRPPVGPPLLPPPPYVEHQNAKKVRNDVNVHKDTLRLVVDPQNPDHLLLSFVFDALLDGSITILYFGKEETNCTFIPLFPEACMPVRIPFQKGLGQNFQQLSGTGIDLGFFELDDLAKPSPGEDVFPLVISAETSLPAPSADEHSADPMPNASPHMQITQAVLEKNNDNSFQVKVIRQILWIDGVRYELREIFGIGNSAAEDFDDNDQETQCAICMTEPKDTAVLPCRHMCMCSECAKALRLQSNKCPICRHPIEELIGINISKSDQ